MYVLSDIWLNNAVAYENAGNTSAATAEYSKAADLLERAFHLEPEKSENINNLILALDRSGQEEKALQLTSEAVAKNPDNPNFHYAYGVYLLKREDYEGSVREFKKSTELDPTNPNYAYNCGAAYLNWGVAMKQESDKKMEGIKGSTVNADTTYRRKFRDALPFLKKSTELKPDDAEFWQSLAKAYTYLGMVEESRKAFDQFDRLTGGR
jgi:Flp pilus assembly protein TadD